MRIKIRIWFAIAFLSMAAGAHAMSNPFLGKKVEDKPDATMTADTRSPPARSIKPPLPPVPPPPVSVPMSLHQQTAVLNGASFPTEEKVAAWVVKGKVDDDVFIEDANAPSHALTVKDNTEIEGGCMVRYPDVICGKAASRAKREATYLEKARTRAVALEAENTKLNTENQTYRSQFEKHTAHSARYEVETGNLKHQVEELKSVLDKAHTSAAASDAVLYSLTRETGRVYRNKDIGSFSMLRADGQLLVVVSATQSGKAENAFAGSITKKIIGAKGILYILDASVAINQPGKSP